MTKRIRKTRKHARGKTRKKQRGGMFKAVVDSVLNRFQSRTVDNSIFVDKLRTILNFNTSSEIKATLIKDLMRDNKEQINNAIWVTMSNGRYTIHDSNKRVPGGMPLLLFQILYNVPEFKRDRSIYHAFLDNGGDMDKKINPNGFTLSELLPSDFDPVDERIKKKKKKHKKTKKNKVSLRKTSSSSKEEEDAGIEEPNELVVEQVQVKSLQVEIPKETTTAAIKKQKPTLDFTMVPSYDTTQSFWEPLFQANELIELKTKFDSLIKTDIDLKHDKLCGLCEMVQTIIPSFSVRLQLQREKKDENDMKEKTVFDQPDDLRNMNIILCSTILLLGFIAKKLEKQDYTFMFKGGKSVQLAFAYAKNGNKYKSEDIDILIIPNKQNVAYNSDKAKALALNISYLIRWCLNTNFEKNLDSQIMESNPTVVKFAYQGFLRDGKPIGNKTALADIDFSDIPEVNKPFYTNKIKMFYAAKKPVKIVDDEAFSDDGKPYFGEDMLFYFQSMEQQIYEKLYYYLLYTKYKEQLLERRSIEDKEYEKITVSTCNYYLAKFKRSLLALLRGYGFNYLNLFSEFAEDDRVSEVLDKVRAELVKEIESSE